MLTSTSSYHCLNTGVGLDSRKMSQKCLTSAVLLVQACRFALILATHAKKIPEN